MGWITAQQLSSSARCLPLGDIVYIPQMMSAKFYHSAIPALARLKLLPENIAKRYHGETDLITLFPLFQQMEAEYEDTVIRTKREPGWAQNAPRFIQRQLRAASAIMGYRRDIFCNVLSIPFTNIGYVVVENGLTEKVIRALNIQRLNNINQLSNLHDPVATDRGERAWGMRFTHTRYLHSLDALAIMKLILHNNRSHISRYFSKHLLVAAIIHDAMTPAGGDGIKPIDPIGFCEEQNIGQLLQGDSWERLKREERLSKKLLIDIVQGRGIRGEKLNIADKISYVARDLYQYLLRFDPQKPESYSSGYQPISELVKKHPNICNLWDSVKILDKNVVFRDSRRLALFLKLRVLLFRYLYLNHETRPLEALLSQITIRYLYEKGFLSKNDLLQMNDHQLDAHVESFTGLPFGVMCSSSLGDSYVETYASWEEAKIREHELRSSGADLTLVESLEGKIKASTHFLVERADGVVAPFQDLCSDAAEEIQKIATFPKPVYLYYLKNCRVKSNVLKLLQDFSLKCV